MEGGWITGKIHSFWVDPRNYRKGHPEDVRQGEFDDSKEARVNMMDFRVGETESWFHNTFPLVQRFISEGGYRLYPDMISLPTDVAKIRNFGLYTVGIILAGDIAPPIFRNGTKNIKWLSR